MDPTKRVNDLIVITDRLASLLERENAALRDRRNSELHEILDEKVTLSRSRRRAALPKRSMHFWVRQPPNLATQPLFAFRFRVTTLAMSSIY